MVTHSYCAARELAVYADARFGKQGSRCPHSRMIGQVHEGVQRRHAHHAERFTGWRRATQWQCAGHELYTAQRVHTAGVTVE